MTRRRVCILTGTRAEFGLLRPVIRAVQAHEALEPALVVTGAHLLAPAETWREVEFTIDARVPMQEPGASGRLADAKALGRGVQGLAETFEKLRPDWVVVLGDRIEALAGACAASIGGIALAHIHGGDRAEGVADEAMRHAITKLAHLHLAATEQSADRIVRMGEPPERVVVAGSPAIDGLDAIPALTPDALKAMFGAVPAAAILMHPAGLPDETECAWGLAVVRGVTEAISDAPVLVFAPNHDPGRAALLKPLREAVQQRGWVWVEHLPRDQFVGLLKHLAATRAPLVGNSSAGLIECAALGVPVVNAGPRQLGRERGANVVEASEPAASSIAGAIRAARQLDLSGRAHPYGDGRAAGRIASALAGADVRSPGFLRKRNAY